MNIDSIEKKDNTIVVTVTVPSIVATRGRRVLVTTEDVKLALQEKKTKVGECLQPTELWNTNPNQLSAQWVFSAVEKKTATRKPKKSTPTKTTVKTEE
tara:strand:+ start:230 stop:523 length:294 start_codon:yes stop_codon:yes gene_type:complete